MKPPRSAQPIIHLLPIEYDIRVLDKFPYDKFEIENCPLTQYFIQNKVRGAWKAYIIGSKGKHGYGDPFGFVRANANFTAVYLHILPYNFPRLFSLLGNTEM